MAIAHSRLTSQGQVSVPAEVRRRLGVAPGSIIEWDEAGGAIVVRRAGRYSSAEVHAALFPQGAGKPRSLPELKAGVRAHMQRRHARR
ncbi:MAG: AbrB/MazE/SpoVT family DNA-binding domain-containing protein [Myxococcales bacterium]